MCSRKDVEGVVQSVESTFLPADRRRCPGSVNCIHFLFVDATRKSCCSRRRRHRVGTKSRVATCPTIIFFTVMHCKYINATYFSAAGITHKFQNFSFYFKFQKGPTQTKNRTESIMCSTGSLVAARWPSVRPRQTRHAFHARNILLIRPRSIATDVGPIVVVSLPFRTYTSSSSSSFSTL